MTHVPPTETQAVPRIEPAPDYHWEGPFEVNAGGDAEDNFRIKAMIGFHGELIEGSGVMFLEGEPDSGEIALTGTRLDANVSFEIWISDAEARTPFVCTGALSADEQRMEGAWTFSCFDPENCGCDGGAGRFELTRVRD